MLLVTQALPVTGRRGLDVDAATALVTASERRADEEVRQVRAALRSAYADLVSAQVREAEIARARDRLRDLDRHPRAARKRRRRRRLRPSSRRARGDGSRRRMGGSSGRTRAGASRPGGLLRRPRRRHDPSPPSFRSRAARPALPAVEALVAHAEATLPELAALRQEIASAEFAAHAAGRRLIPEPEIVAGTKSSNLAGGDIGSVFSVHVTIPLFDRAKPENAQARSAAVRRPKRVSRRFESSLRAQVAALRAIVLERRQAADAYRASHGDQREPRTHRTGQLRRRRARHSRAARRLSQRRGGPNAPGAARRRRAAGGDRARTRERMGDPMMRRTLSIALILGLVLSAACRRATDGPGQPLRAEAPTLDVTSWTEQTELFMEHPPLVAGRHGPVRRASHAARRLSARSTPVARRSR